jgi:hypothetical protein
LLIDFNGLRGRFAGFYAALARENIQDDKPSCIFNALLINFSMP